MFPCAGPSKGIAHGAVKKSRTERCAANYRAGPYGFVDRNGCPTIAPGRRSRTSASTGLKARKRAATLRAWRVAVCRGSNAVAGVGDARVPVGTDTWPQLALPPLPRRPDMYRCAQHKRRSGRHPATTSCVMHTDNRPNGPHSVTSPLPADCPCHPTRKRPSLAI